MTSSSSFRLGLGTVVLLLVLMAELTLSVQRQSQTFDEGCHLYAGYRYWQDRDFGNNPEHPPLIKLVAALPLLNVPLKLPPVRVVIFKLDTYWAGSRLLYSNDADSLLFRARLAASVFTLLLACLILEATHSMFGIGPALLALTLLVFEPNVLAHGALVTTDMGVTCCLFAAVYSFYRYIRRPSFLRLVECGVVSGLALAAKHSGLIIMPILLVLACAEIAWRRGAASSKPPAAPDAEARGRLALRLCTALFAIGLIALSVLWAFYSFQFQARPHNLILSPPLAEIARGMKHPWKSSFILFLARNRILPEAYLYGLADVARGMEGGPAFILGKLYSHGRWFYFPSVFLIKSSLGFLSLIVLALASRKLYGREYRRESVFLAVPAGLYLGVSMTSGLNIGIRHILPIFPFLIIIAASGVWVLAREGRRRVYLVICLTAFQIYSSVRAFPNYLAYSNEIFGGPGRTYRLLSDSDVDWGQGLKAARNYLDRFRIRDCWLAYYGTADAQYYNVPCKLLSVPFVQLSSRPAQVSPPTIQGTVLISASEAAGVILGPPDINPYAQFQQARPADNIGGSILVFKGRFDLPLAAAMSHTDKAWELTASSRVDQAVAEARTSVSLAPGLVGTHWTLGMLLVRQNQRVEARRELETALSLAQSVHPEYQTFWVPSIRQQLAGL